jgi:hypothetical protein
MDTSKERHQVDMVKDVVLHHIKIIPMGNRRVSRSMVGKKGEKGKEQTKDGMSQKSISPAPNTRNSSQCTHPTESATMIKKPRKKETIPRASVLGIGCT